MSAIRPIRTAPSEKPSCAAAGGVKTSTATSTDSRTSAPPRANRLDTEISMDLRHPCAELVANDGFDDAAMLDDVVAVRKGRDEGKVLLDEEHRVTLAAQRLQGLGELANDDR